MQTSMLVNLQRLDAHGKPHPWLFVGNRITRCLVCGMVISLATATRESHDFNRGRCQNSLVQRIPTAVNVLFVWVPTVKKCAVRVNYCQWDSLAARAEQVSFVDLFINGGVVIVLTTHLHDRNHAARGDAERLCVLCHRLTTPL